MSNQSNWSNKIKKVLLLGSGALKIGEAGEFDYSGSQALKALKEEGLEAILINPNIATIQTSQKLASKIYFLPVDPYFVAKVIEKERPGGVLLGFGGQTALNCGLKLAKSKIFKKFNVKVLGTSIKTIEATEDREIFAKELSKINIKVPRGDFASSLEEAKKIALDIGFPLIVRSGFTLGGLGSAVVENISELIEVINLALKNFPQVAVEEYLKHWKEIEYEIVRDSKNNKISVCNMENLDPMGIHTGESIVVAPSQALTNYQYHMLRNLSLKVIEHLGVVGECNIQFALDPKSNDYRVIEVNARLSRSSALASKATGYPLAYVAAKIALGHSLPDLKNQVTKSTSAFFEPALDYIVVKIPRWDLQKFIGADPKIGSSMKSVGEVMAIARSFPEALQKAIRSLETGQDGFLNGNGKKRVSKRNLAPSTERLFVIAKELCQGKKVEDIYHATGIDPWFLYQIQQIVEFEKKLQSDKIQLTTDKLLKAKQLGFSDKLLAKYLKTTEKKVREFRKKHAIVPKVKHIDTLAAEYPAKTNYLYLTYNGEESEGESVKREGESQKAIVIGSGPYRIGSSVEFDWCSVESGQTLAKQGFETIIINCNPETVSTDFDIASKLYFEELTYERVSDIYEIESHSQPANLVLSFGGQVPNNLAISLFKAGYKILGTSPESIDRAENRHKFSALLDSLHIDQPSWRQLESVEDAVKFAKKISFPVLVRPSYVLSGSAMNIAYSATELKIYLNQAADISLDHPVVISKFIDNAKEIEIDGVGQNGELILYAISEHIENAGVHSGDATIILPPQRLYLETMRKIKKSAKKIIKALNINGPFNIQFLAKDNHVSVIELNLRASRSFPFVSKVTGYNFVEIATKIMLGQDLTGDYNTVNLDYVGVKAPQFSFNRIKNSDPRLRVEMSSTGEVACFGDDLDEAYLKSLIATGFKIPQRGVFLSVGGDKNKLDFLKAAKTLSQLSLKIYATEHTNLFLNKNGVKSNLVFKISQKKKPSILELLQSGEIDLAINISEPGNTKGETDGFIMRRSCIDFNVPLLTNLQAAQTLLAALASKTLPDLQIKSWDEYVT